jgi:pimeloyl-ACP methyl ester carboxylesterase
MWERVRRLNGEAVGVMSGKVLTAAAADGTQAQAIDEGLGMPILVVHGGMGDSSAWVRVTDLLRDRFRTVRLARRQYRLDLPRKITMAQEVEHVTAIARQLDRPLLVGHSSGAVLVLEALVAEPELYSGAVLYEPPSVIDKPLGGGVAARAALNEGKPGKAMAIFLREAVEVKPAIARLAGIAIGLNATLRGRVERQLDDLDAINELGVRLEAYARIEQPILLLGGDKSPRHLGERLDALEEVLPHSRRLLMHGQGHGAENTAPERVAGAIAKHIDEELAAR